MSVGTGLRRVLISTVTQFAFGISLLLLHYQRNSFNAF